MNIEDFDFSTKQLSQMSVECSLINKESKNKFCIIIKANGIPPNDWIFSRFLEDKKMQHFFVDIESEIVNNEVIIKGKEIINEELKNIEKNEKKTLQDEIVSVI